MVEITIESTVERNFKLENFEGPIDLLLHLIRKKKLDILEISLVEIADQYIMFVEDAKRVNLEIASEYLLIAAQLIEIKSKHLMSSEIFVDIEQYEEDTKQLLERLVQYERYKKMSENLISLLEKRTNFDKLDDEFVSFATDEEEKFVNLISNGKNDLQTALDNIYAKLKSLAPVHQVIKLQRISVEDRRKEIEKVLNEVKETSFISLITRFERYFIAITLLVLLEMSLNGKVILKQTEDYQDIEIKKAS